MVRFPDLDGAITGAASRSAAMEEAADCLGSWLSAAILRKDTIPRPSILKRGQVAVAVPFWVAPKVALYREMYAQRINNSELARRLGVRETVVRRMLDPDHATNAVKIEAA